MCDLSEEPVPVGVAAECDGDEIHRRGDLLVCNAHASVFPANVGRVEGETRCFCGGFKPTGSQCGEPCEF